MRQMLKKSEEIELARAWRDRGCERSRARLVEAYQPLIRRIAWKYLRAGLNFEDLVQEGVIGFMAALDNFDPDRGHAIGALARWHVASRVNLYVNEFSGSLRLPNSRRLKGLLRLVVKPMRAAEARSGRRMSNDDRAEMCRAAGYTLAELEAYEQATSMPRNVEPRAACDEDGD